MPGERKIHVIHFNNGTGGGVLSVINNLIAFSANPEIENHIIFTIEKNSKPTIIDFPKASSVQFFHYDRNWNFYYTCKQLKKLIPDEKTVLVAHDWLELGMASNLGLQNPVVQFLHGDYEYYYDLATKHQEAVDYFISVSLNISNTLKKIIPSRVNQIRYLRFPVPDAIPEQRNRNEVFQVLFLGRLNKGKGYNKLPLIAKEIEKSGSRVMWHIIGENSEGLWNPADWNEVKVHYHGKMDNEDVRRFLPSMDCLILPSLAEGMPISVIEAMQSGVVPVVNNLVGGIQELIIDNETGYKIEKNEVDGYAEKICLLANDRKLLLEMGTKAKSVADKLFNPLKNTRAIEDVFLESFNCSSAKTAKRVYGSRMDQAFMPNLITKTLRKFSI